MRLGDADPGRRLRFDALARYLHDVADDDATDAQWPASVGWVLRRTEVEVGRFPQLGENLHLDTFCSAASARWAERTTVVTGAHGARLRAVALWVAIDVDSGAPARLGETFDRIYGPSAAGRRVSARLQLPAPGTGGGVTRRAWPLRHSDLDVWNHVNNAVSWAAVEDAMADVPWTAGWAMVEHNAPIASGTPTVLATQSGNDFLRLWLVHEHSAQVLTSALAAPSPPPPAGPPPSSS